MCFIEKLFQIWNWNLPSGKRCTDIISFFLSTEHRDFFENGSFQNFESFFTEMEKKDFERALKCGLEIKYNTCIKLNSGRWLFGKNKKNIYFTLQKTKQKFLSNSER